MPTNEDNDRRAKIAARIIQVREAAGMDQRAFVDALNAAARGIGLPAIYDIVKVSKIENSKRDVSLDDAILVADVDPHRRSVRWLAGARETPVAKKAGGIRRDIKDKRSTGEA